MRSALDDLKAVIKDQVPVLIISGTHDLRSSPASIEALNLTDSTTHQTWVAKHGIPNRTIGSIQYSTTNNVTHATCHHAGHMIALK